MEKKYSDWVFILEADKYPKAKIIIKKNNIIRQTILVKWESRYEALNQVYKQYIKKNRKGEIDGDRNN